MSLIDAPFEVFKLVMHMAPSSEGWGYAMQWKIVVRREVEEWFDEHGIDTATCGNVSSDNIWFRSEADAMLFKLRWL